MRRIYIKDIDLIPIWKGQNQYGRWECEPMNFKLLAKKTEMRYRSGFPLILKAE
jgi:hypothetical protein